MDNNRQQQHWLKNVLTAYITKSAWATGFIDSIDYYKL